MAMVGERVNDIIGGLRDPDRPAIGFRDGSNRKDRFPG
jgi:hypothetical protein